MFADIAIKKALMVFYNVQCQVKVFYVSFFNTRVSKLGVENDYQ